LALGGALELAGCGDDGGGSGGSAGTASGGSTSTGGASAGGTTTSAGTASSSAGTTSGSSGSGGAPPTAGTGSGGTLAGAAGSGGSGAGSGGSGGSAGGAAGSGAGGSGGGACPPGPFTGSPLPGATATATRIAGAPPADTFNNMGNDYTTVEGPVWIGDALYFSEMLTNDVPKARILKIAANDAVSELLTDSGSNGLATDGAGNIVSANHKAHGLVRFSLPDKTPTTLVSMASSKPLNSPNDLVIAKSGTIYFTDPTYQNMTNPQGATRVYQFVPGQTEATVITDYTAQPNGIGLSLDEQTLLVGGMSGVKKYPITNGAVAMTGAAFGPSEVTMSGVNTDGMTQDCAGNLYVAVAGGANIVVVKPDGSLLGTITATGALVTNVAFGGADRQTLYITGQGSGKAQGVFKVHLNIPGLPY
jgi:sugar lactone lactonase YvrE